MTVDRLMNLANQVADAYAHLHLNQAYARQATSQATYDQLIARVDYWNAQHAAARTALNAALRDELPATPETFLPVRVLGNGHIDLHARDSLDLPVVVRLTGGQALSVGAHLIASAAIGLDRTGAKVTSALPLLPATTLPAHRSTAAPDTAPTPASDTARASGESTTGGPPAGRGGPPEPAARRPHPHRATSPHGDRHDPDR